MATKKNAQNVQTTTAEELINQAKVFGEDFGIDAMPNEIGKKTDTAMAWILQSAEHGTELIELLAVNAPDYNYQKVVDAVKTLCTEYNSRAKHLHYNKLMVAANPILAAVDEPDYKGIKYSESKNNDDDSKVFGITDVVFNVDLESLYKHCKKVKMACGVKSSWYNDMATILMQMIVRGIKEKYPDDAEKARKEAVDMFNSCYKIKEISAKIDTDEDPTSITKLQKALTELIADMIGEEYKPLKCDVRYLLQVYCQGDRRTRGNVKYVSSKEFSRYLLDVLCRIVKGKDYTNSYKTKKS